MNDKVKSHFNEDGMEVRTVSITRGDKVRTFEVREMSYGQMNKIGAGLNHPDLERRSTNMSAFGANMVSSCVTENGNALTFDEATNLPSYIGKRLEKEAMSLNNYTEADDAKKA